MNLFEEIDKPELPKVKPTESIEDKLAARRREAMSRMMSNLSSKLISYEEHLETRIRDKMKEIVLMGLGIQSKYGKYEFYGTNGFVSGIKKLVEDRVMKIIEEDAPVVIKKLLDDKKLKCEIESEFRKQFESSYLKALQNAINEEVNKRFNTQLSKEIEPQFREFIEGFNALTDPAIKAIMADALDKVNV